MQIEIAPGQSVTITCVDADNGPPAPELGQTLAAYAAIYCPGAGPDHPEWPKGPDGVALAADMTWAGEGWIPASD